MKELTVTEPTKPVPQEQSIARMNRETTITKEQLDKLWNALEYTRATIGPGGYCESKERTDWIEIHKGRAFQSKRYLTGAIDLVEQLKEELK